MYSHGVSDLMIKTQKLRWWFASTILNFKELVVYRCFKRPDRARAINSAAGKVLAGNLILMFPCYFLSSSQ